MDDLWGCFPLPSQWETISNRHYVLTSHFSPRRGFRQFRAARCNKNQTQLLKIWRRMILIWDQKRWHLLSIANWQRPPEHQQLIYRDKRCRTWWPLIFHCNETTSTTQSAARLPTRSVPRWHRRPIMINIKCTLAINYDDLNQSLFAQD